MAGTRTVHRGSRGRFAGASQGKAEQIKVGRGYSRSPSAGNARPQTIGGRGKRIGTSIAHGAHRAATSKAAKFAATTALATGVSIAASSLASRALHGPQPKVKIGIYSGKGVGRKEVVGMPNSPLRREAQVGGRSVKDGAFVAGPSRRTPPKPTGPKVNYSSAVGRKEYVGRRLKPGEGYGFKLKVG